MRECKYFAGGCDKCPHKNDEMCPADMPEKGEDIASIIPIDKKADPKEWRRLYMQEWRARHPDYSKTYMKSRRMKDPDANTESCRKWRQENREKFNARQNRYQRKRSIMFAVMQQIIKDHGLEPELFTAMEKMRNEYEPDSRTA